MNYRREIDGLRAIAVLPVIFYHGGINFFSGGYVGVDVFFVISGYLITLIIVKELNEEGFSLLKFYERRARRILPALVFVLLACFPFAWIWMMPSEFKDFSQGLVSIGLFSSNIFFWKKSGYFSPEVEENPLIHTWSLSVEEQFYIFFPLLVIILWKYARSYMFHVVLLILALSFLAAEWGWRNMPAANFYLLPTRAWELGIGAACAIYLYKSRKKGSSLLSVSGLLLIIVSVVWYDKETPFPSIYTLVPVGGTALVILYGSTSTLAARILSIPILVGIGLISYSAYLWHQPLFAFARIRSLTDPSPILTGVLSIVTIAMAYVTWKYVEKPFRRKPLPLFSSRMLIFSASGVAIFVIILGGLLGHVKSGFPERFIVDDIHAKYIESATASPLRTACHADASNYISPEKACEYHNVNGAIAVFGDSHTVELAFSLANYIKGQGMGVKHFSFSGCVPSYLWDDKAPCTVWTKEVVNHIVASDEVTHVIISYRIHAILLGKHYGVYPEQPNEYSDDYRQNILDSLYDILDKIIDAGKVVIFVNQSPEIPNPMDRIVYTNSNRLGSLEGVSRNWWDARTKYFNNNFEFPDEVIRVNTEDIFCDKEWCYAGQDGVSYYFDTHHLSLAGSALVAEKIVPLLLNGQYGFYNK